MTDEMLEQRLRAWYRGGEGDSTPLELRVSVAAIADAPPQRVGLFGGSRNFALLAAAALLAIALIGGAVIGAGLLRLNSIAPPSPSPGASLPAVVTSPSSSPLPEPTPVAGEPTPASTSTPEATASPEPTPAPLIAVYHGVGNPAQILTLDPTTGDQTLLGTVDVDGVQLRSGAYGAVQWSADRRFVTISRVTDGAQVQAQIEVSTGTVTSISVHMEGYVSPTGDRLAGFGGDPNGLQVTDLAGNVLQQLTIPNLGAYGTQLVWAPDESALAVWGFGQAPAATPAQAGVGGAGAALQGPTWIFMVPLDSSPVRQFGGSSDYELVGNEFSPDMSRIAAIKSCMTTCTPGIVSIDVASGTENQLTTNNDSNPTWSPDGTRVAFERTTGAGRGIWVMNADGSGLTRLTTPSRPDRDHSVAWSPDGTQILFSRGDTTRTGLGDLYIMSSAGGDPTLLLTDAVGDW